MSLGTKVPFEARAPCLQSEKRGRIIPFISTSQLMAGNFSLLETAWEDCDRGHKIAILWQKSTSAQSAAMAERDFCIDIFD